MSGWYHKNMDPLTYLHLQMRLEGKDYVVADGDVMHFRFAT